MTKTQTMDALLTRTTLTSGQIADALRALFPRAVMPRQRQAGAVRLRKAVLRGMRRVA